MRIPTETVLTPRLLLGACRRLSDAELAELVEELVNELDQRAPDPDREPEPEDNSDPFAIKAARADSRADCSTAEGVVFCFRSRPEVSMRSGPSDPQELAAEAVEHITALAHRGADSALVERETTALIAGWMDRPGSIDAMALLRDQLEVAAEEARARYDRAPRGAQGVRTKERVLACLEVARDATKATLAVL